MTIRIKPETFTTETTQTSPHVGLIEIGTIEATFAGKTQTVKARRFTDGDIYLMGFVGRYRTSPKPWRATVSFFKDAERPHVFFGRDDRSGRFQKANMISYEPETYAKI